MAWISMIGEDEAEGELKSLYDLAQEPWGGVDNILKIHSLNPSSLAGHIGLYRSVMRGSKELSKARREMIAVAVSALNHCIY
jgi:alkylhydroperoxidase family enzyme